MVLGKSFEECFERLNEVLALAESYGLQINWKLCQFMCQTIEYLGFEISFGSIKPSQHKTFAVERFPEPNSVKRVQSFLGLTGYFRKFVRDYSILARPLTQLLKKDQPFKLKCLKKLLSRS